MTAQAQQLDLDETIHEIDRATAEFCAYLESQNQTLEALARASSDVWEASGESAD